MPPSSSLRRALQSSAPTHPSHLTGLWENRIQSCFQHPSGCSVSVSFVESEAPVWALVGSGGHEIHKPEDSAWVLCLWCLFLLFSSFPPPTGKKSFTCSEKRGAPPNQELCLRCHCHLSWPPLSPSCAWLCQPQAKCH